MTETLNHPTPDRLEAYVEGALAPVEKTLVESHLTACVGCETEVSELRSLFTALSSLPSLAPSPNFAQRVMQGVRVRKPWAERLNEWLDRVTPSSTRGWAIATSFVALPALVATGVLWWLLSHPAVEAQDLWLFASSRAVEALALGWQWGLAQIAGSSVAAWATVLLAAIESVGRGSLGLAAASFATLMVVSVYVLYDNLFRTNARRTEHASYSF